MTWWWRFRAWASSWWSSGATAVALGAVPPPPVAEPAAPAPLRVIRRRRASADDDRAVHWQFRRDILERLDEYFYCLRRMRAMDPDNYQLFARLGLSVPARGYLMHGAIPAGPRPLAGGVLCPQSDDIATTITPSFVYFVKVAHPTRVQAASGDVYALTAVYDDRQQRGLRALCTCHVAVSADGNVQLLREAVTHRRTVAPTKRRRGWLEVRTVRWAFPTWLASAGGEHGTTPEAWATGLFTLAYQTHYEALARVVIRATRGPLTAAFGIDLTRAPRFFRDRDRSAVALARDGKLRRIFHAVVRHDRHVAGQVRTVRSHYRGLRGFAWRGYRVRIVWPETDPRSLDVTGRYAADIPRRERAGYLGSAETGAAVAAVLER